MDFKNLKDRMLYYRSLTDYKIMPNCYTLVMLDGRSFSKLIKKKYKLPFDGRFITMMNETAKYICQNVQGALFAYVQSDEINILLSNECSIFFEGRLSKMLSIIASMASNRFNQIMMCQDIYDICADNLQISQDKVFETLNKRKLVEFDCKVWNVPSFNDVYAWFLYRQNDCIRNSKQQSAQTYLSHNVLFNKDTDEQIRMLKEKKGIDWETEYSDGEKYGRFIYKEMKHMNVYVEKLKKDVPCERTVWNYYPAFKLQEEKDKFSSLIDNIKKLRLKEN